MPGQAGWRRGAVVVAMTWLSGSPAIAADDQPVMRGDPTVGEALAKRWCSQCHLIGDAAKGTDAAPTFVSIARNPAMTPDHLRAFLGKPHQAMPPIPLSGTEADDLIAYIRKVGR